MELPDSLADLKSQSASLLFLLSELQRQLYVHVLALKRYVAYCTCSRLQFIETVDSHVIPCLNFFGSVKTLEWDAFFRTCKPGKAISSLACLEMKKTDHVLVAYIINI